MENKLTQTMIDSMQELLRRLIADRDRIQGEIDKAQQTLRTLQTGSDTFQTSRRLRRPRGANKQAICELLSDTALELGVTDIFERTGIPLSSVGAVLKKLKEENIVEQSEKGLWRKKAEIE